MSELARVRSWFRTHSTVADGVLALALLGILLLPFYVDVDAPDRFNLEMTPLLFGLLVGACACLVLRRRYPWGVWAATTALGLAGVLVEQGPTPVYVPAIVALYTVVSTRVGTAPVVGATLASALGPVALIIGTGTWDAFNSLAYGMVPWSGLAAVSGIAVRSQRAVVEAAHERARQAVATREEEAQRRVVEERLRIARELHDVVAHHVSVINVQAGVASHLLRTDPDGAADAIGHVREASQTVLREVPSLLGLLRTGEGELDTAPVPRLTDVEGLVNQARRSGLEVVRQTTGTPLALPPTTDLTAYRVVQEGLTNAARHGTGQVLLRVDHDDAGFTIEIRNPQSALSSAAEATGRHGLIGMRERVAAAGGTFSAGLEGPGTWVVRARLPVSPAPTDPQGVWSP